MPTLAAVTEWTWEATPDHRGKVPAMPEGERRALVWLNDQHRLNRVDSALRRALMRKLRYRADRDRDQIGL